MPGDNICRIVPSQRASQSLKTLHFVCENAPQTQDGFTIRAVYSICLVTGGRGRLNLSGKRVALEPGDVFFIFPAVPFFLDPADDLKYMYISYFGLRACEIADRLQLKPDSVFKNCSGLIPLWSDALRTALPCNLDLISESVLLHTLGYLLAQTQVKTKPEISDTCLNVKKYIDDRFLQPELSLQTICTELCYNPKYISTAFKKQFGISFHEYLRELRMHEATELIRNGYTCVNEIASFCGFDDPLYFSRCFRRYAGLSPREAIRLQKANAARPAEAGSVRKKG